jgi:hypothetical protein
MAERPATPFSLLMVTQEYPPYVGGAEIHSQRLADSLFGRGHSVSVITLSAAGREAVGAPVLRVRRLGSGRARNVYFALATAWLLATRFRRYDAVHWTMPGLYATVGLPIAHWLGIKNVVMFAGSGNAQALRRNTLGPLFLWMMRRWAERMIVLNAAMIDELEQLGAARERIALFT